MPIRDHPTNGTLSPPLPQAKPIISDDTVAALTGASACPNVTLTGSVDCRKNPPIATSTTNDQPSPSVAANRNGTAQHQRQRDDPPRPESIGGRAAEKSADAARKQICRHGAPDDASDMPRLVSMTGMNVAKAIDVIVRSTTMK